MPPRPTPSPSPTSPGAADARSALGAVGEQLAAAHLVRLGFSIVTRNYRTRWGELDIVAHAPGVLAFVEVKTRRASARAGSPFDAVTARKQAQVRRIAAGYLARERERPYAEELRFDVIGVTVDDLGALVALEHREGVF